MNEIQAALGICQMNRLDNFVSIRQNLKKRYDSLLISLPIVMPFQDQDSSSALHLYPILINLESVDKSRKQIFDELKSEGIGVNIHYIPIHTQPYYSRLGFKIGDFPNSEAYYERAISIPLFHSMSLNQQDEVINALNIVLK